MNRQQILDLYDHELRRHLVTPGYIREETEHVIRHVSQHGERGFIIASDVNEENASRVIREELAYFNGQGSGFEWKVYSYDKPGNLKELLETEGFECEPPEALMVLEVEESHPLVTGDAPLTVTEITDEKGICEIISLMDFIWADTHDELGTRLWRDKQNDPDSLFLYGLYEGDKLISASWMYFEENSSFASLWGGSTLPEYRKKGCYTSMLSVRAKKAWEHGYRFLTVDASPMSRPILEKYGFQCLAQMAGCQSPERG